MLPQRKKLIEVALPLDAINKEAAREKSIRHGHPSTLHLWWARRPLAACRAVLFASLVDDPGNDLPEKEAEIERKRLFGIIEELVLWENSNDEWVLHAARTEIARSAARSAGAVLPPGELTPVQVGEALEKYAPPVLDPFCGGGSIPLEAQRLGLKAYASDLNPVAVLITKALIEIPPKFAGRPPVHPRDDKELFASEWKGAAGLAEDVRYYGQWMRDEAEKRIGHLYPKGPNGETVIAWLWARTVKCPNPACGATMPLIRSFALSTKSGKQTWVEPEVDKERKTVGFQVKRGRGRLPDAPKIGRGAQFKCLVCGQVADDEHIKSEGRNGRMAVQLMAVVAESVGGRTYYSPTLEHETVAKNAHPNWFPDAPISNNPRAMYTPLYGLTHFHHLFTPRQLVALSTFSDLVSQAAQRVRQDFLTLVQDNDQAQSYANAVATYLGFALDKAIDRNTALCTWETGMDRMRGTFGRQALPMIWDFAESNPFAGAGGDFAGTVASLCEVLTDLPAIGAACISQLEASAAVLKSKEPVISTDPPYYDNVPYAALSDFFYIWLRRSLGHVYPDLFSTLVTPKTQELVADQYRHGDREHARQFFEHGLVDVFRAVRTVHTREYPLTVYYAFKQAESEISEERDSGASVLASTGWETMLEGLVTAGLAVTGTWPMSTELGNRTRSIASNALASSIVLVCRPRPSSASLATRREFVTALRKELPHSLTELTHAGIAPVDLAQASIGPGMAVFSRHAKVLEADGTQMSVRTALQIINLELDEYLTAEEGDLDRETRFALAWFQQFGNGEGAFGEADVLARAKDTAVDAMVRAGILHSRAGKVRLLRRGELEADWDPRADARLTVWECTQQLIRRLNETGEAGAARLLKQLGAGRGEEARALAYRLYAICERKKWADEALAYNALVVSWPEIEKNAAGMEGEVEQGRLL